MTSDQELLARQAAKGDQAAFEQLMLANQKQVYSLCLRMCGNAEDALDLSQEAFLRAWRSLPQFQFGSEFSTWLYRLTRNICIDFLRWQKRQKTVPLMTATEDEEALELPLPDPAPGPEEQAINNETKQKLLAALEQLPEEHREILILRVVNDLPYEKIAQVLELKEGTVKSRLARARISLKKLLEDGNFAAASSSEKCIPGRR